MTTARTRSFASEIAGFWPKRGRALWAWGLLMGVTVAAYLPALSGGFIWDDDTFLTQNQLIKAGDGLYRFWFTTQASDYWPVTSSSLWVEWRLWGMHAWGYHATNLGLHLLSVLLLWAILRRLKVPGAYLAAFLFAVHPVNVESAAWIAQRKNLLAMVFYLASIGCFLNADIVSLPPIRRSPAPRDEGGEGGSAHSTKWYCLSLLAFTLAMLSKGSVAFLPIVLLGLIAWHRRLSIRDGLLTLPFFLVSGVLALTDVWFQKHGSAEVIRHASCAERLLGAGAVVWFYLYKALLPLKLIFVYPQWSIRASDPLWWLPLLAVLGLTGWLWRNKARRRAGLFAWTYFCVALAPVMGFTDVYFMKYSLVADHYQHLAIIGVMVWIATKAEAGRRKAETAGVGSGRFRLPPSAFRFVKPVASLGTAAIVIAALAILTWRQCQMYRDVETLYRTTIAENPECWMAEYNLGIYLAGEGRLPEALARYERALALEPRNAGIHSDFGAALARTGRLPEAIGQFQEALRLQPGSVEAHLNLGLALQQMGRTDEAIAQIGEARRLGPEYPKINYNLGIVLQLAGRAAEAVPPFMEAVRLRPDDLDARLGLAGALAQAGRLPEAAAQFAAVADARPGDAAVRNNLAVVLAQAGRLAEAAVQCRRALEIEPGNAASHYNFGLVLLQQGRRPEARAQFAEALRLQPDYPAARERLDERP